MLLVYVDESGTWLNDKQTRYFVMCAVTIPAEANHLLELHLSELKRRLVPHQHPEGFEIKGRHMRRGGDEGAFHRMNQPARLSAMHEVAQLIAQFAAGIHVVQVDKRAIDKSLNGDDELYCMALAGLLPQLDAELDRMGRRGMLLLDSRSSPQERHRDMRALKAAIDWIGARTSTRLAGRPWFGTSLLHAGLQLADFTAYVLSAVYNGEAPGHDPDMRHVLARFETKLAPPLILP
jgi:Protein of unknown function (DUF3800)